MEIVKEVEFKDLFGNRCREVHYIDHSILIEHIDENYKEFYADIDFTCFGCTEKLKCKYAWDLYNINNDCLASK